MHAALSQALSSAFEQLLPLVFLLAAIRAVAEVIRSPAGKGVIGEKITSWISMGGLDSNTYRSFHNLYLPRPDGNGTTQIDHVIVSRFGIFVIETKNRKGWIFGDEESRNWTQVLIEKKYQFQNPLHQNRLHVRALKKFLSLPEEPFHSIVHFVGECEFRKPLPPNVLKSGLRRYIQSHREPLLDPPKLREVTLKIEQLQASTGASVRAEHTRGVQRRLAG